MSKQPLYKIIEAHKGTDIFEMRTRWIDKAGEWLKEMAEKGLEKYPENSYRIEVEYSELTEDEKNPDVLTEDDLYLLESIFV